MLRFLEKHRKAAARQRHIEIKKRIVNSIENATVLICLNLLLVSLPRSQHLWDCQSCRALSLCWRHKKFFWVSFFFCQKFLLSARNVSSLPSPSPPPHEKLCWTNNNGFGGRWGILHEDLSEAFHEVLSGWGSSWTRWCYSVRHISVFAICSVLWGKSYCLHVVLNTVCNIREGIFLPFCLNFVSDRIRNHGRRSKGMLHEVSHLSQTWDVSFLFSWF